jgi:small subunit ribosomal protein S26e
VARDKAIKRFVKKQIVDIASMMDVARASIYYRWEFPRSYQKAFYCVSCAVHRRIVKVRSRVQRTDRLSIAQKRRLARIAERRAAE